MILQPSIRPGATCLGDQRCRFVLWAPAAQRVLLRLLGRGRTVTLQRGDDGYHSATLDDIPPGERYFYRLDSGPDRPDPASLSQPDGVHGPSEVFDTAFDWTDRGFSSPPLDRHIIYELHIGAFTPQGTFDALIPHLSYLRDLGITAVEPMPIAQFPGPRNWGYDGVGVFAAQNTYGGPRALQRLVDACHARGLGVFLDVVHNHLGPEGNYLADFGPYFTDRYRTPWGRALNFDGPLSDHVRAFFIASARSWIEHFHIDGLRLDALHAIADASPQPFIAQLAREVHDLQDRLDRRIHIIAESAANDARLLRPPVLGGFGLDAQWNDDFHHALRTLLTGERTGYYADYGRLSHLAAAFEHGFVYTGQHSAFHKRRHGSPSRDIPARRFIVFSQNHDHAGNRPRAERLAACIPFDALKLAAAAVLLSPFVPLLFMGEEYAETAPFPFFISHSDPGLIESARRSRAQEFAALGLPGEAPDPQSERTFTSAKLDHTLRQRSPHRELLDFYKALISLRRAIPALAHLSKDCLEVQRDDRQNILALSREVDAAEGRTRSRALILLNFGHAPARLTLRANPGEWRRLIDSSEPRFSPAPGGEAALITPPSITSDGRITIDIAPTAIAAFAQGDA